MSMSTICGLCKEELTSDKVIYDNNLFCHFECIVSSGAYNSRLPLTHFPTVAEMENRENFFENFLYGTRKLGIAAGFCKIVPPPEIMEMLKTEVDNSNFKIRPTIQKFIRTSSKDAFVVETKKSKNSVKLSDFQKSCSKTLPVDPSVFWANLEEGTSGEVAYGNDVSLSRKKLGRKPEKDPDQKDWSFTAIGHSLFRWLDQHMPGITTPMEYYGNGGTVFCMHTEDGDFLSFNFLEDGEDKLWWGIPGDQFEQALKLIRELVWEDERINTKHFEICNNILRHRFIHINPRAFNGSGVCVNSLRQRKGEIVITFPRVIHWGYNQGPNHATAVNFYTNNYLPFIKSYRFCRLCPQPLSLKIIRKLTAAADELRISRKRSGGCGSSSNMTVDVTVGTEHSRSDQEGAEAITNNEQGVIPLKKRLLHAEPLLSVADFQLTTGSTTTNLHPTSSMMLENRQTTNEIAESVTLPSNPTVVIPLAAEACDPISFQFHFLTNEPSDLVEIDQSAQLPTVCIESESPDNIEIDNDGDVMDNLNGIGAGVNDEDSLDILPMVTGIFKRVVQRRIELQISTMDTCPVSITQQALSKLTKASEIFLGHILEIGYQQSQDGCLKKGDVNAAYDILQEFGREASICNSLK